MLQRQQSVVEVNKRWIAMCQLFPVARMVSLHLLEIPTTSSCNRLRYPPTYRIPPTDSRSEQILCSTGSRGIFDTPLPEEARTIMEPSRCAIVMTRLGLYDCRPE